MPHPPILFGDDRTAKKPAWLNDPTKYRNRGDVDFASCSQQCLEQGDFFGLDDLFTEQSSVMTGLADIYADRIRRYKLDGFRIDTARHVNAAFFRLWVPRILAAARAAGVPDFQLFGEVFDANTLNLVPFVRDRRLPNLLDFPFQDAAIGFAAGESPAAGLVTRLGDDDYFRLADGVAPTLADLPREPRHGPRGRARPQPLGRRERRRAAEARPARARSALPPARRAGRLLRRRGRDGGHRRRQGRAPGHVPDAGLGLAHRTAYRQRPDRQRLVLRRPTIRSPSTCARSRGRDKNRAPRPARRSSAPRRGACSP